MADRRTEDAEPGAPASFQVLSLDGGGLKGLFSAALLSELESDLGTATIDHFDLVVGTSTGGLVALALGAGLSPQDVVRFFAEIGPKVFGDPRGLLGRLFRPKHDSDRLRAALEEVFGDRRLGDSRVRLLVTSYSLDRNDVYIFKTPHHEHLARDWKERMVDVAVATTAAPTYLPAARRHSLERHTTSQAGNRRSIGGGHHLIVVAAVLDSNGDPAADNGAGTATSAAPTSTTAPFPSAIGPWRRLSEAAPPVSRGVAAPVWTGSDFIVWSLEEGPAVRFDPQSETATELPRVPIGPPSHVWAAAWTGHEVLAWGHSATQPAAGYDRATDAWRRLPPPPLSARMPFAVVWTGAELIVWGDLDRRVASRDGAAYDPVTNQWRLIARRPSPVAMNQGTGLWTGQEMLVVGAFLDDSNTPSPSYFAPAVALAYNPTRDKWRRLGSADLEAEATWGVWSGDRLVAWDYALQAREWTSARGWRKLAAIPLQGRECFPGGVVAGPTVLMTYCDQAAILRPDGRWEPVTVPGQEIYAAVTAGDRIIIWTEKGAWALGSEP